MGECCWAFQPSNHIKIQPPHPPPPADSPHGCSATSRQTAAICASSMQVSVTTSVSDPPARYSITTNSSSPIRKLTHKTHKQWLTGPVHRGSAGCLCFTCLKSWQCWGSSAPSSLESRWWWAPSWAASEGWSVWWPPGGDGVKAACLFNFINGAPDLCWIGSLFWECQSLTSCPVATSIAVKTVPDALKG